MNLKLVEVTDQVEVWQVGKALMVLPVIRDHWSIEEKNAVDRRRRAQLTGQCDCGAKAQMKDITDDVVTLEIDHEYGCPATDSSIEELFDL